MAKKKQTLSQEELLEQALVPDYEWPYSVPENWIWTKLDVVSEIVTGGTPSKNNPDFYNGTFPFIKPADLDQGRHVITATEYLSEEGKNASRVVPKGSTSICCIGTIGKCGYLEMEATTNQQINSVVPKFNPLYTYYYCNSDGFINQLKALVSATTISIVNKGKMSAIAFPLPPLAEQQRIVDRIESLFEKLDQAKELIQDSIDSFENRKSAILHKAFSGDLTKKWREENGVGIDSWEHTVLKDLVDGFKYGTSEKSDYNNSGIPVLRIPNVILNKVDFLDLKYLVTETIDPSLEIIEDDILIIRSNGSRDLVGKCALVPNLDVKYTFASYLIRIRANGKVLPKFLMQFLNSSKAREQLFNKSKSSAGINNINSKELGSISLMIPTIPEQYKIVNTLEGILEIEERASELIAVIENIEVLKKSILSRAFRSELGTNDKCEESSLKLLHENIYESSKKETNKTVRKKPISIPKGIREILSSSIEVEIYKQLSSKTNVSLGELYGISADKFEILEAISKLEKIGIIIKNGNDYYEVVR